MGDKIRPHSSQVIWYQKEPEREMSNRQWDEFMQK